MLKSKVTAPWLIALGFALLFIASVFYKQDTLPQTTPPTPLPTTNVSPGPNESLQIVQVTKIIDGDTIVVSGEKRIRYIGIDTPEPGECFGQEASKANSNLVLGKEISLETDVQLLDKYGRTLAYVWLDNTLVNETLVRQGYAKAATYPPNVKYQNIFLKAEQKAREEGLGLWADNICKESPISNDSTSDVDRVETNYINPDNQGCLIKGNINSKGEKIYHLPGQRYYEKTQIEEAKGESWFCSEEEAEKAGWRKSKV